MIHSCVFDICRHVLGKSGRVTATQPLNWSKDSQKHDLDPLADKKFYWDSSQVCRSKVAIEQVRFRNELYKLAPRLVKTTLISMNWARSPQRGTWWTGPLTRKNYTQKYDSTKWSAANHLLNWPSDSWKLRSKVSNDQCTCRMYTCELTKGFPLLVKIMMKTKRF